MQLSLRHILLVATLGALAACGSKPADGGRGATSTASATPATPTTPVAPAASTVPTAPAGDFVVAGLHGDATRGATIFNQCRACHALNPGQNGIGPTLHAVIGRSAGAVAGYSYSTANKTSHRVWDKDTLFAYLESPMMTIPGTKMTFRLADAQARADVIAYLATQN